MTRNSRLNESRKQKGEQAMGTTNDASKTKTSTLQETKKKKLTWGWNGGQTQKE